MQSPTQEGIQHKNHCKIHPTKQITTICKSPFCGYYRQLCQVCILSEKDHIEKYHLPKHLVISHVQSRLKDIQKGILILKKQKQEKQKTNPITLPYEVKQKLENIREIINEKITLFEKSLEQMYQKQVNMKLQSLSETLKKSLDFLKREQNELQQNFQFTTNLKRYFLNFQYWQHQRKYYKSYMQEILEKQVKSFKQGFDDDHIMKLIVSFEINLKSIFSRNKQNSKIQILHRPHLFFQEKNQLKKYQIVERMGHDNYTILPEYLRKTYPKQNYKWIGSPQSLYYSDLDCFFIFGQGETPSNVILKYEDGRITGNKKLSLIGQMSTKRSCFSTCLINGQIFIIGGYNQKQGCLVKCQKMVFNPKMKIYLVSSLQQRSSCHTVCNYKNKFIVKFGGTSIKVDQQQNYKIQSNIKQLYPEIYDLQKQQWRVIRYNTHNPKQRLQFGLEPLIVIPYQNDQNKIIVFGNRAIQKFQNQSTKNDERSKKKFEIKCFFSRTEVEMKIIESYYHINKKYVLYPQTCQVMSKKNHWKVIAIDKTKTDNHLHLLDLKYQN